MSARKAWPATVWALANVFLLYGLHVPVGGLLTLGPLLDPWDGVYRTARMAEHPARMELSMGSLAAPVTVERDARGVPHIFAENDWDALVALGYVVAQDRLFQMDFVCRVASGRLAEIFGPGSIAADRFLRSTGMERAAQDIARKIHEDNGLELRIIDAFARGANAYIESMSESDLPFEFRLFGSRPEPYTALQAARIVQYFNYDLSYETDDAAYGILRARLGDDAYARLYPLHAPLYVPIVPADNSTNNEIAFALPAPMQDVLLPKRRSFPFAEGFKPGKGSNNWAVFGARSATGMPLLAGDMHLELTLPSTWYEAHLATPTMNIYGVLSPGTPLLIEAFNDDVGWVFTNMGADAIDFYALELDESGQRYRFEQAWRDLVPEVDTIYVKGAAPVVDTLWHTHMGPLRQAATGPLAMRWAAFEENHTLTALWGLAHSTHVDEADSALKHWGAPAQNVLLADGSGEVAMRSAGYIPTRHDGGSRAGILDGTSSATQWSGRLPHRVLPFSKNPAQGYLTSSNQQPTARDYPYYLGHNWPSSYRSLRLEALLSGQSDHSLADMKAYQQDVHVVQRDLLAPHLGVLGPLSGRAALVRDMLLDWDGTASTDRSEPLVLHTLLEIIQNITWDEPVFAGLPKPRGTTLFALFGQDSPWLDVVATPMIAEDTAGLLRIALMATADTLGARYGSDPAGWRWGTHHKLIARHVTQSAALSALWSDTYEYPGFAQTVSPGDGLTVTKSASWRMIVDFSEDSPRGYGIYFGGQSGNPFSRLYDLHMEAYVTFGYYDLKKPTAPGQLGAESVILLRP